MDTNPPPDIAQPRPPFWVRFCLWGLKQRRAALTCCILSVLLAVATAGYAIIDPRLMAICAGLVIVALWYWLAIKWVDNHGGWSPSKQQNRFGNWAWVVLVMLAFAFAVAAIGCYLFFGFFVIPQNGMYPTLPAGAKFIALRRPYSNASEVKRGDIVAFTRKEDGRDVTFIWRVVAVPGDKVAISDSAIYINGKQLERTKVRSEDKLTIYKETNGDAVYEVAYEANSPGKSSPPLLLAVPPNQFIVLGDNRNHAMDSRYFGPIPFESIVARKW